MKKTHQLFLKLDSIKIVLNKTMHKVNYRRTSEQISNLKKSYLGNNSSLMDCLKDINNFSEDDKKIILKEINDAYVKIEVYFDNLLL